MRDWMKSRAFRILVLTLGLYVLSQAWAQLSMEVEFPFHFRIGPFAVVLFYVPEAPQTADAGHPAGD